MLVGLEISIRLVSAEDDCFFSVLNLYWGADVRKELEAALNKLMTFNVSSLQQQGLEQMVHLTPCPCFRRRGVGPTALRVQPNRYVVTTNAGLPGICVAKIGSGR